MRLCSKITYQHTQRIEYYIKSKVPKFQIKLKEDSWLMRLLSKLLFFNKIFMSYITTIYPIVYVPKEDMIDSTSDQLRLVGYVSLLLHESRHLFDRVKYSIFFNLLYLSPQIFALLAILAIWNLWFLLFLALLAPIPSLGRAWLEYRGSCMTIAAHYWVGYNVDNDEYINYIIGHFVNGDYYFMFPFKGYLVKKFKQFIINLKQDNVWSEALEIKNILVS
jgi:hypothetical protein